MSIFDIHGMFFFRNVFNVRDCNFFSSNGQSKMVIRTQFFDINFLINNNILIKWFKVEKIFLTIWKQS